MEGVYQIQVSPSTGGYTSTVTPGGGTYLAVIQGDSGIANIPDFVIS